MKKIVLAILVLGITFVACKSEKKESKLEIAENKAQIVLIEDGVYAANVETSTLNWKGFKPTGSHNGVVAIKEGNLTVRNEKVTEGKFTFDMASITVLDIPADDKYNAKLVNHLKSPDFFDVENNPTATFEIIGVEGDKIKGNLIVKEISKPVEFIAKLVETEVGIEFSAEPFKIDRTEYNIQYKSKKFFENIKDKFINDEFEISFKVKASK